MTISLDLIGIAVADMGTSLAFYRALGLDIPAGAESEDHVEITLPNGLRLAWDSIAMLRTIDPTWTDPQGSGRINLAFRCDSPADVDRVHAELVAAGYESHMEPWDAFWGQRYAVIHDPDANGIDLFAALAQP